MTEDLSAVLPRNAVSVRELGDTERSGGAVITNVTVTCAGLPVAPADVTVTWPMCVPADRPDGLSVSVIVAGAVPVPGAAVSPVVSLVAPHDRMPPPGVVAFGGLIFEPRACRAPC